VTSVMSRKESVCKSANEMFLVEQNPDFLSSIITCDESWI
jgi:hypothetical protein